MKIFRITIVTLLLFSATVVTVNKPKPVQAATCVDGATLNFSGDGGTWSCTLTGTPHDNRTVSWCYTYHHSADGSVTTKGYANGDNGEREYSGTNSSGGSSTGQGGISMTEGIKDDGTIGFRFTADLDGHEASVNGTIKIGSGCSGDPDPQPTPQADLVPRALGSQPGSFTAGTSVRFQAKERNRGEKKAKATTGRFRLDLNCTTCNKSFNADVNLGTASFPALNPGQTSPAFGLSNAWTAVAGKHVMQFCADRPNQVAESDESNNCDLYVFSVANPIDPSKQRNPYLTTKVNGAETYGDIHAGAIWTNDIAEYNSCHTKPDSAVVANLILGKAGITAASTAASSTGDIVGFGSAGNTTGADYTLGNDPSRGKYKFPICRPPVRARLNALKASVGSIKNKHRQTKKVGHLRIEFFGSKSRSDTSACGDRSNDIPRIKAILEGTDPYSIAHPDPEEEVLIWCDTADVRKITGCQGTSCRTRTIRSNRRIRLPAITVKGRKTLYVTGRTRYNAAGCTHPGVCPPNVSKSYKALPVRVHGNITYDHSAQVTDPKQLPGFALVSDTNILIRSNVTELFGYYFAGARDVHSNGEVLTCQVWPFAGKDETQTCNNTLTVHGMLSGERISFWRTGDTSTTGGNKLAELIGARGFAQMFIGTPPPGFNDGAGGGAIPGSGDFTIFERPPIF